MIPIVTPAEMAEVDRQAAEPVEVLIGRAGYAVARAARDLLGGTYGRRVTVIAGPGNNGADGHAAAAILEGWGAGVTRVDARNPGQSVPPSDLIIDAAFGTGLRRPYVPPATGGAPVLAVDIPSGLSGDTGRVLEGGRALPAVATVTFQAYKPGLLIGDGPRLAGDVEVADIGLGALVERAASACLIEDGDVVADWPRRGRNAHKWQQAVLIVGGSPGMYGAPWLVARSALRAGAGYARVRVPGAPPDGGVPPGDHVSVPLPAEGWAAVAAEDAQRFRALVVGPGLGPGHRLEVAWLLEATPDLPAIVDADGLTSLEDIGTLASVTKARSAPLVITPHEGEYTRLVGQPVGEDRLADVRDVASRSGAVVLLKGSTTVVAAPDGEVRVVTAGSSRLATAGTGDVLSGAIGAALAGGLGGLEAAAVAAHVHGRAAANGPVEGLVASDLPALISEWLSTTLTP